PENAGIAVGDKVTLNAANKWKWTSDKVLPKGTKVTFAEVTPVNLPGVDWGAPEFSSEPIEVGADETAVVKIKNTPIPTTPVDVDKSVTGPKGKDVEKDESSTFQVKATWTAWDGEKSCIFDVVPGKSAVPAEGCEATIIDDKVYFPRNTEITFEEVGQNTDVPNVKWQEVLWTIAKGKADITVNESEDETKAPTATVTITGDKDVTIGLENKTSSNGLIIIPIPIPLPPFPGGSSNPPTPNTPVTPGKPGEPTPGKPGHPGKPLPQSPSKSDQAQSAKGSSSQKGLARTGANVIWLAGGALLLLAAGAFLITRNKKRNS
ncbi:MAG: LPXTG cell wall anchor domain-containing protein, partial [Corynebacterium flavescens]|uniref:LPXTG cell wall anchor domain-containing protein n=1 Tax=Corynebacterium flavescens TaxID=28028 RepID=UPI002647FB66